MADLPFSESEAGKYVLGQLAPAERRAFAARLDQSPELRALVRELEEGLTALALSAPQHQAPREAWQNIQAKIAPQSEGNFLASLAGFKWLLNGWAAATCITAVLILKIAWPHLATTATNAAGNEGKLAVAGSNASPGAAESAMNHSTGAPTGSHSAADIVRTGIASRSTTVESNTEEMMSRPGGADGLQLVPPDKSFASSHMKLSPQMQRAMLLAVAKQMGWSIQKSPSTTTTLADNPARGDLAASNPGPDPTIDFVYLPSESSVSAPEQPASSGGTTELFALSQGPDSGSLPLLQSGPDVFAFLDPSELPPRTGPLTVWLSDPEGNGVPLGTVRPIKHPTVIVLPALATGYQYFITAGSSSNILGRYPTARDLELDAELETDP